MMYVVCFYWQGERWQEKDYQPETEYNAFARHLQKVGKMSHNLPVRYINNLYWGVKRFATKDFKFICFSNEDLAEGLDENIEVRPFDPVTKKGVLPRMYMFSKDAGLFGHQVFCLDLDVIITGPLKDFMDYEGLFCVRTNFRPANEKQMDGDIMSFRAGEETEKIFWKPFVADIHKAERITMGRERFWMRHVASEVADTWDEYAPGQIASYKRHIRYRKEKPYYNTRIVSCHGFPRPHQITDTWRKTYWI